jgi:hypothetical protein
VRKEKPYALSRVKWREMTSTNSDRVGGMAVFYGFFFAFVGAVVTLNEQVMNSANIFAIRTYYGFLFLLAISITLVGFGLSMEIDKLDYPDFFKWGIDLLTTLVPILLLVVMGYLLGFDDVSAFLTITVFAVVLLVLFAWKARKK